MPKKSLSSFVGGINNKADKYRLPVRGEGNVRVVRNAVNVDVNNEGGFSSRETPVKVFSGVGLRDGYSCPAGSFFRQGALIKRFDGPDSATVITQNVTGGRIAWGYFNDAVFFSDGIVSKKIYPDGSVSNWGIAPPSKAPVLSQGGKYGTGQYQACYTFVAASGVESGASPVVTARSGGRVSGMLTSTDNQVAAKRIYITEPNGSTFFLAGVVLPGVEAFPVPMGYTSSRPIATMGRTNPPPGTIIRAANGRMFICSGPNVWYTDEWSTDLVSISEESEGTNRFNCWSFPSDVTMLEFVEGGAWLVADKTYFIAGKNPNQAEPTVITENTAVKNTSRIDPNTGNAIWMSDEGIVVAGPGGQLSKPQAKNVAVDQAEEGAITMVQNNGVNQIITTLKDPVPSKMRASSWFEFEVVKPS